MNTPLKVLLCVSALLFSSVGLHAKTLSDGLQQQTSAGNPFGSLVMSDWSDIRAAREAGRYAFQPVAAGWMAENPGQQWITRFDSRGFIAEPKGGGWQWGFELHSYGFGEDQHDIGGAAPPAATSEGQRLCYQWDATMQEWWVNDGRGLEHGFTVMKRPEGNPGANHRSREAPLSLTLLTRGTLQPGVAADGQSIAFKGTAGAMVLNYSGLKVWDADGKVLSARFTLCRGGVQLLIEERSARYPLTIDPVAQQTYLKPAAAGTTQVDDQFGYAVAASGDTVVVGAPFEDSNTTGVNSNPNETGFNAGAVYVFVRTTDGWTQQAYLKVTPYRHGANFGISVGLSGDTLVVGASGESSSTTGINTVPNENAQQSGAAYIFVRTGTTWTQQAYLKPAAVGINQAFDRFGSSVAISGNTVVVGAPDEDSNRTGVNSTPNDAGSIGPLGTNPYDSGAAYVFVRNGTTWTQQAYLKAAVVGSSQEGDSFGRSVAVSGDTVVVGAPSEDSSSRGINSTPNENSSGAGAAYVFVRSGTTWTQQAYLKPAVVGSTQQGDTFGNAVAVSGDTVAVGAYSEDSNTTGVNSVPNETGVINSGGFYHYNAGAVYIFVRSGTAWTQQAYLKPDTVGTTGETDVFGAAISLSGDMLVVGAQGEDSSTTGVNITPNESAGQAGAAYIFTRTAGVWAQQAFVKPAAVGTTQTGDAFGSSVAISEDGAVVIGAPTEDSSTTGIQSTANESSSKSGAAYIFIITTAPEIAVHDGAGTSGPGLTDGAQIAVQFPVARQGSPVDRDFTVANTGDADLHLSNISVPSGFSVVNPPVFPLTVTPGNTLALRIRLNATALGTFTGSMVITSDDPSEAEFDFPITGTVVTPEIAMFNGPTQTSPELTDGQAAPVDFGVARQGTPVIRSLLVKNTGTDLLLVNAFTIPAGYSLLNAPALPVGVAVGGTLLLNVRLDAGALGTFQGLAAITSDDFDEPVFDFPVTGIVVSPEIAVFNGNATTAPELTDGQAEAVDFGRNVQGTARTLSFTITNTGTANLLLNSVTLPAGYTSADLPPLPLTMSIGQLMTFHASLSTLTVGTHAGSVVIGSDDLDEASFDFPVSGEVFIPDPVATALFAAAALNRQTGLREQIIHLTNDTTATVPAYNLVIRGLPAGVEVNNASAQRIDGSWVVYVRRAMNPHTTQDILLEYFSATRLPVEFTPQLSTEVVLVLPDLSVPGEAPAFRIDAVKAVPGGVLIEFPTTAGSRYQVQYSNDGTNWQSSLPSIQAVSNRTQWVDRGLPRTDSPPSSKTSRFYRVAELAP